MIRSCCRCARLWPLEAKSRPRPIAFAAVGVLSRVTSAYPRGMDLGVWMSSLFGALGFVTAVFAILKSAAANRIAREAVDEARRANVIAAEAAEHARRANELTEHTTPATADPWSMVTRVSNQCSMTNETSRAVQVHRVRQHGDRTLLVRAEPREVGPGERYAFACHSGNGHTAELVLVEWSWAGEPLVHETVRDVSK